MSTHARQQLRRYQFHELLGRGGMGEVYRGRAIGFDGFEKVVAIKRLRPALARDRRYVARLVREAKLLVALQHSNLVGVLDLVHSDPQVFIVLEYMNGPSLAQLLAHERRTGTALPLGLVSYIGQAVCAGLAFAHDQPGGAVIHADLSPSNVLFSQAGEIKVADFGIARRQGARHQPGTIEGKLPYMSPEQLLGLELGPASDVFAMGVLLYQMITNTVPFDGAARPQVHRTLRACRPAPLRAHRPDVPEDLARLCLAALAPDPSDRPARMREIYAELRAISFASGWRDDAADLACRIRRVGGSSVLTGPLVGELLREVGIEPAEGDGSAGWRTATQGLPLPAPDGKHGPAERSPTGRPTRSRGGWLRHAVPVLLATLVAALTVALAGQRGGRGAIPAAASMPGEAAAGDADSSPPVTSRPPEPPPLASTPLDGGRPAMPSRRAAAAQSEAPTSTAVRGRVPRSTLLAPRKRALSTLRIHAEPWAYVSIDGGTQRRETPLILDLVPGRRRVRLENPVLGVARTVDVLLRPGRTVTIQVDLASERAPAVEPQTTR